MSPPNLAVRRADERAIASLARSAGLTDITARALLARGVGDPAAATRFLRPRLAELRPPHGLAGFERGVERIARAVCEGDRVAVFGDYDVDGVTTAALLTTFLRSIGATVEVEVADRQHGYGFSPEIAGALLDRGARLIITGDCGTSDIDAISLAAGRGVDVVVIDHHTVPDEETAHPAHALINPYCQSSTFPFRGLASVGLAFYVAGAVRTRLRAHGYFEASVREPDVRDLLDLVALGTIADLMPLLEENRILVTYGLRTLAQRARPGVAAMLAALQVGVDDPVDEKLVSWRLAPRLNAPGRLGSARLALELLLADAQSAGAHAAAIEQANTQRREVQDRVWAEVVELMGHDDPGPAIVLGKVGWPSGVMGIVAAKLVDRWQRPAFLVGVDAETLEGRGSARTAGGIDLTRALAGASHRLARFGGHATAAGFSVRAEDPQWLPSLREAIATSVASLRAGSELALADGSGPVGAGVVPALVEADAEVSLLRVTPDLVRELLRLAPFGQQNPTPRLLTRGVVVVSSRRVGDGSHLQVTLGDGRGVERRAILFRAGELVLEAGQRVDCVFTPGLSTFNGRERLDLELHEVHPLPVDERSGRASDGRLLPLM